MADRDLQTGGKLLRELREQRGITLSALTKISGVSTGYLSEIERASADKRPSKEIVETLCRQLNAPPTLAAVIADCFNPSQGPREEGLLYVDGMWLSSARKEMADVYRVDKFLIDFDRLLEALSLRTSINFRKKFFFLPTRVNLDLRDDNRVQGIRNFLDRLKEDSGFKVYTAPVDYRGERMENHTPRVQRQYDTAERNLKVQIAELMIFNCASSTRADSAILVSGDKCLYSVTSSIEALGGKAGVVSFGKDSGVEPPDLYYEPIWLEDILNEIELRYTRQQLTCESHEHVGNREVWTTYQPRPGERFYCEDCKRRFAKLKEEVLDDGLVGESNADDEDARQSNFLESEILGEIKNFGSKMYGFIRSFVEKEDFFFHISDVVPGVDPAMIEKGLEVQFKVKKTPTGGKAGAATEVRPFNSKRRSNP